MTKSNPKVSVIMPVYNAEKYISDAITSVQNQSLQDFELLIFNDGSTDNTLEIAQKFAENDYRIKIFDISSKNNGPAIAAKYLLDHSKGEYIAQLDADDILQGNALELCASLLNNYPDYGFVYTDCYNIDENNALLDYGWRSKKEYSFEALIFDFITFHMRMFRKSVYDLTTGIDDTLPTSYDYDLALKLSEVTKVKHLAVPLYYYRINSNGISKKKYKTQSETTLKIMNSAIKRRNFMNNEVEFKLSFNKDGVAEYRLEKKDLTKKNNVVKMKTIN